MTSRRSDWHPSLKQQALGLLSRDEGISFLLERTAGARVETAFDAALAGRLADLLQGLPLALEQAAAFIVHTRLGFVAYLDFWNEQRSRILEWSNRPLMQLRRSPEVTHLCSVEVTHSVISE